MKKVFVFGTLGVSVLLAGAMLSVSAQDDDTIQNGQYACDACEGMFLDEDQDGICDHLEAKEDIQTSASVSSAKQGVQYVDVDGDGICDRKETDATTDPTTYPQFGKQDENRGQGYVDADGDGICDQNNSQTGMQRRLQKGKQR